MPVEVSEISGQKFIEIEINRKLTKEDYDKFVPVIENAIVQQGKISMLVVLHEFHGWSTGALWEDVKFDWKHFGDLERLAIVGEAPWQTGMAMFCRPFTAATIKYFDHSKLNEARDWLAAGSIASADFR